MSRVDTTNRLMAVIDDPAAARDAADALRASGFTEVTCLAGGEDVERLDRTGRQGGARVRLARLLSYVMADQSVDLATYEAALRDGRGVLAIQASAAEQKDRALHVLRDAGAHFVNFYAPLMTEDIIPWRGDQLSVPYRFHR